MAHRGDHTTMGGPGGVFLTTRWSEIRRARGCDETRRNVIIDGLIRRYWKPVYCYLRRKGYDNDDAKELTQGFFHKVVLERDLVVRADECKGRFRTFLLTALDRYVIDDYRSRRSKPTTAAGGGAVSLDAEAMAEFGTIRADDTPQQSFNHEWAVEVLDRMLNTVRDECADSGKIAHWNLFQEKVVYPILNSCETPALADLCRKHDVESEAKASNMIVTVKRRCDKVLQRILRESVQSDSDVEEEFSELIGVLSGGDR